MGINDLIVLFMMGFMLIGALDRILVQFGGAPTVLKPIGLGRLGKAIEGAGAQFEEGFMTMGILALAIVGLIAGTPVIASLMGPVIIPIYKFFGASPAGFAATVLCNDTGGYFLAKELATSNGVIDYGAWMYNGLIVGSMLGPVIMYTIPVGLGLIDAKHHDVFAQGILLGLVTIPLGCVAGGITGIVTRPVAADGTAIIFSYRLIFMDLIPVVIFSATIAFGLWKFQKFMIRGFLIYAKILVALITVLMAAAVLQAMTGIVTIPGLDPIIGSPGDRPGIDIRSLELCGVIAIMLCGAYPMVFLLSRWFRKPLVGAGQKLGINQSSAAGLLAILSNFFPSYAMLEEMDHRGKIINIAFSVSASFTLGDHLAFTASQQRGMIIAMVIGKLVGGISAVMLALVVLRKQTNRDAYGALPAGAMAPAKVPRNG